MKRRNFLKGLFGASVVAAVPALVGAKEVDLAKFTHTTYPLETVITKEALAVSYDYHNEPMRWCGTAEQLNGNTTHLSNAKLLKESMDILDMTEYV